MGLHQESKLTVSVHLLDIFFLWSNLSQKLFDPFKPKENTPAKKLRYFLSVPPPGIALKLLSIITRFAQILLSTLGHDSPAQRDPGSVFRFLVVATNGNDPNTFVLGSADLCLHQESNPDQRLRSPQFYPLNYRGCFLCFVLLSQLAV